MVGLLVSLVGCHPSPPTPDRVDRPEDTATPHDTGDTGEVLDQDGDGHLAPEHGGDDCDDHDPGRHPGHPEICDDVDQDCDDAVDEGLSDDVFVGDLDDALLDGFCEGFCDRVIDGSVALTGSAAIDLACVSAITGDARFSPWDRSPVRLPNLTHVGGDLWVSTGSDHDLSALTQVGGDASLEVNGSLEMPLERVGGDLQVAGGVLDLRLPQLVQVGAFIEITDAHALRALDVSGVSFVALTVRDAAGLTLLDVSALPGAPRILVADSDRLETVLLGDRADLNGTIEFYDNRRLATLDLSGVSEISGALVFSGQGLTRVDLSQVDHVSGAVRLSAPLTELALASGMTLDGALQLSGTELTALDLGWLETLGSLTLSQNPALTQVDLSSLVTAVDLGVSYNDKLTDVDVGRLESCRVSLYDNGALASVDVPSLESGALQIERHATLQTVSADGLTTADRVIVSHNDALDALSLPSLERVSHQLTVVDNPALEQLELPSLTHVGAGMRIEDNGICDAELAYLDSVTVGGTTTIANDGVCE